MHLLRGPFWNFTISPFLAVGSASVFFSFRANARQRASASRSIIGKRKPPEDDESSDNGGLSVPTDSDTADDAEDADEAVCENFQYSLLV